MSFLGSKSSKILVREGLLDAAKMGASETYLGAFGVWLGGLPYQIGALATLPQLVGSMAQALGTYLSERAKRSEGAFSLSPSSETSEASEAKRAKKLSICLTLSASSPFIIFNKQKKRQQGSPWRLPESSGTRS